MLFFFNKKDSSFFTVADIENEDEKLLYISQMVENGFSLLSEKDYNIELDKISKVHENHNDKINDNYRIIKEEAIADAKKLGWTDAMIEQTFGRVE